MRNRLAVVLFAVSLLSACSGVSLFKSYEYEEEMYLSLDGSATIYVNSSVAALNALRGTTFDTDPSTTPDREQIQAYFSSPNVHVTRVTFSRRSNRRFIHVRADVDDIRRLGETRPFAWSSYQFAQNGELFYFKQTVGPSAGGEVGDVGWTNRELVAFRMHLPSKIAYHNAGRGNPSRGNILSWEQTLEERRQGVPLMLDARMETQSILYRTLALFGVTFVVVAALFALLLWWVIRRAKAPARM